MPERDFERKAYLALLHSSFTIEQIDAVVAHYKELTDDVKEAIVNGSETDVSAVCSDSMSAGVGCSLEASMRGTEDDTVMYGERMCGGEHGSANERSMYTEEPDVDSNSKEGSTDREEI